MDQNIIIPQGRLVFSENIIRVKIKYPWDTEPKSTSAWTRAAKHTATYAGQSKATSVWTNQTKHKK